MIHRHALFAMLVALLGLVGLAAAAANLAQAQAGPEPSTAEIEAFIKQLEDPTARAAMVDSLRLLAAVQSATAPEADLGGRALGFMSERVRAVGEAFATAVTAAGGAQPIWKWLRAQVEVPERRALWLGILWKLAMVVAAGLAVGWLVARALRHPRRLIEQRAVPDFWIRLPLLLARALLEMAPIGGFYAATSIVLAAVQPDSAVRLVALAAINAAVLATALAAVMRLVFTPLAPSLRLIALDDETSAYAFVWVRRLVLVPVVGFFAAEAALGLGLPSAGHVALLKLVGLAESALFAVLILQLRRTVAIWIRGEGGAEGGALRLGALRQRVADIWHVLALLYLVATYLIWAFEIAGGFVFIVRASLLTVLILIVARAARVALQRALDWLFRVGETLTKRFPALQTRANSYVSGLRRLVDTGFALVALLLVAQAWSIDVFGWLAEGVGNELLIRAIEIAAAVLVAVAVWEIASGAIATYLAGGTNEKGERVSRSARARTLLPLARNALLVIVVTVTGLSVLATLGVNIAPLLAGAGVVGLAVGFGAQTLVKDVITGAFILFEDTVQVGDVVEINGKGGLVEALTVRTIRLRDLSGNVHTIPFSAVATVINMTREYSHYLVDLRVAYDQDTDAVVAVLREVDAELRGDAGFAAAILAPIDVLGLDRFEETAVVVRARLTTKPLMQWTVGREFNRRLKKRLAERRIALPAGQRPVLVTVVPAAAPEPRAHPETPTTQERP